MTQSAPSLARRLAFAGCALALPACALVFGLEGLSERAEADAGSGDAASEASVPGFCESVKLAARPTGTSDAGPLEAVTFGLEKFSLAPTRGLNLDSRCTTTRAQSSCLLEPGEGTDWQDGVGGADLAGNRVVGFAQQAFPSLADQNLEGSVAYGLHNLLFRLTEWNGTGEDEFVSVTVYSSRGLEGLDGSQSGTIDRRIPDPSNPNEKWVWSAKVANLAYVTGGRLMTRFSAPVPILVAAHLPGPLPPPMAGARADGDAGVQGSVDERPLALFLQDAYLMADVKGEARGSYRLENGILAGRLAVEDFVAQAARLRDVRKSSQPFCVNGEATVSLIDRTLCSARDLRADLDDDGTKPCDALSVAVGFTSHEAQVGAEDTAPPVDPCPAFKPYACGLTDAGAAPADAGP